LQHQAAQECTVLDPAGQDGVLRHRRVHSAHLPADALPAAGLVFGAGVPHVQLPLPLVGSKLEGTLGQGARAGSLRAGRSRGRLRRRAGDSPALLQRERRPKYFQFTPRPQSVKLVTHWSDMTKSGKLHRARLSTGELGPDYPLEKIACPLALFHGQSDYLADCAGLVRHLQSQYVAPRPAHSAGRPDAHTHARALTNAPSMMRLRVAPVSATLRRRCMWRRSATMSTWT